MSEAATKSTCKNAAIIFASLFFSVISSLGFPEQSYLLFKRNNHDRKLLCPSNNHKIIASIMKATFRFSTNYSTKNEIY